jgi:CheY-like chemotaxis protein
MDANGPIVLIEDDRDDRELLKEIFHELRLINELQIFDNGETALDYLRLPIVKPFLIISDINLPSLNGFDIRKIIRLDTALARKCIPYIFFTTGGSPQMVTQAYDLSVQGIFQKPDNYEKWKILLLNIIRYWKDCISPNRYD